MSTYNVDNEEPIAGAPEEEEPSGLQLEKPVLQLSAETRTVEENRMRYLLKSMVSVIVSMDGNWRADRDIDFYHSECP